MKLCEDLYDVYGNKIGAQNSKITRSFVRSLIEKGSHLPKRVTTVGDTPMIEDFKKVFDDRRYRSLFQSPKIQEHLIKIFSRLKLREPLYLELKRMKLRLPETYHHVLIMSALVIKMIKDMKIADYDPVLAASLCLTHDIGKTRISKKILNKKTPLTEEQYQIIKTHPLIGYLLLCYYNGKEGRQYYETAFEHHEKLDGTGYPRGIKRVDRYAQLIAPVDIYDALISKRPYRQMSYNGRLALDILLEDVQNKKLSKEVVYLLINCIRDKKTKSIGRIRVSQKRRTAAPTGNYYGRIKKAKARRLLRSD